MKKMFKMMLVATLAFCMLACGEKKLTHEDMKKAEASLFDENGRLDTVKAPKVAERFCQFVQQNPNDSMAPLWLYHALELNVMMKNDEKSIELCNQLMKQYPDSKWAPKGLYVLGSFVYERDYKDLDKAREIFDRILTDYPDSEIIESVEASKKYLGWTPDQIMADIALKQFKEGPSFESDSIEEDEE